MQKKKSLFAFTLIELMVGISLMSIMALGISQLNFSRLSKNQELSIGAVKINTIFEEVRNNSLLGKGIGVNLETPLSWKIEFSQNQGGRIVGFYTLNGSDWITYPGSIFQAKNPFTIGNINCRNLDNSSSATLSGTGTLIFNSSHISFSGSNCNNTYYKVIEFSYIFGDLQKDFYINTLSGVIEIY